MKQDASRRNASLPCGRPKRWPRSTRKSRRWSKKLAQWRKMNYVVKVSSQPITGTDPNSVMAAISSTLVYADPRNDITNDVIHNLNRFYKATAAPAAKSAAGAASAPGLPANAPQTDGN